MKNGYDQFFKQARKAAGRETSLMPPSSRKQKSEIPHRFELSTAELSQEVERQLRQRTGVRPKKKRKVSWKMATLSFAGIVVCIVGAAQYNKVEVFLQNFEITLLGQAQAETKPAEVKKETAATPKADSKAEVAEGKTAELAVTKSEDLSHLEKTVEKSVIWPDHLFRIILGVCVVLWGHWGLWGQRAF